MKRLPNKLSDRILVALKDLEACENDDRYGISMYDWHNPNYIGSVCFVCLAGSVMAKSLGALPDKVMSPILFEDPELCDQLQQLDLVRRGSEDNISSWFNTDENISLDLDSKFNRKEWKLHMLDVVGRLQAEGK